MKERIQNVHPKEYKGRQYRSTLEAKTAQILDALGIPFKYEKKHIPLLEGFRCPYQKDKVRAVTYTPDFEIGSSILLECKGFETPEWKIKKKFVYKWLMENEPYTSFYQIHDKKQLLMSLDNHWSYLGYYIQVISKTKKKIQGTTKKFDSILQALSELNLKGKPIGPILNSLTGKKEFVYGYNWKLQKIKL